MTQDAEAPPIYCVQCEKPSPRGSYKCTYCGHRMSEWYERELRIANQMLEQRGDWRVDEETAKSFPYRQYLTQRDSAVCEMCRSLDQKVFPVHDPFWKHCLPPRYKGCRCTAILLTKGAVQREGLVVHTFCEMIGVVPIVRKLLPGERFSA